MGAIPGYPILLNPGIKRLIVQEHIIENILGSLDGIKRASPSGFFYEKVRTRLNTPTNNLLDKMDFFFARPAIALSLASFILALNLIVLEFDVIRTAGRLENADNGISTSTEYESLLFGNAPETDYVYNY